MWGTGEFQHLLNPDMPWNGEIRATWARMERLAASPTTVALMLALVQEMDVRAVLPTVRVPTLVVQHADDALIVPAMGKYVADHIPDAKYVELPGRNMYHFVEPWRDSFREVAEFLTGHQAEVADDRVLATVLFTDIVDSTRRAAEIGDRDWHALLDAHDAVVRAQLARFRGREVNTSGDGFLAMFDGPQRAIRCAMAIRDAVQALGIEVRAGLHTGECEVRGDDIGGIACAHRRARQRPRRAERRAGVQHAARPCDRVRTRIRRPRLPPTQGRARRLASVRRRWLEPEIRLLGVLTLRPCSPRRAMPCNGDLRVAYRASPPGARDIVFVSNWFTCCERLPELPSRSRLGRGDDVARSADLLRPAGHGCVRSGHVGRAADLGAMGRQHHRGARRSRESRSGSRRRLPARSPTAGLFAATHPSRTTALVVLQGADPKGISALSASGFDSEEWSAALVDMWGTGEIQHVINPDMPWNEEIRATWARHRTSGGQPRDRRSHAAARARDWTCGPSFRQSACQPSSSITPTTRSSLPARGKYIADHIPGAKYVELPGRNMFHFVEPWRDSFQEIAEFLTGHQAEVADDRVLATVLFTDIVDSTRRAARDRRP